jgi:hypothetical protein
MTLASMWIILLLRTSPIFASPTIISMIFSTFLSRMLLLFVFSHLISYLLLHLLIDWYGTIVKLTTSTANVFKLPLIMLIALLETTAHNLIIIVIINLLLVSSLVFFIVININLLLVMQMILFSIHLLTLILIIMILKLLLMVMLHRGSSTIAKIVFLIFSFKLGVFKHLLWLLLAYQVFVLLIALIIGRWFLLLLDLIDWMILLLLRIKSILTLSSGVTEIVSLSKGPHLILKR